LEKVSFKFKKYNVKLNQNKLIFVFKMWFKKLETDFNLFLNYIFKRFLTNNFFNLSEKLKSKIKTLSLY